MFGAAVSCSRVSRRARGKKKRKNLKKSVVERGTQKVLSFALQCPRQMDNPAHGERDHTERVIRVNVPRTRGGPWGGAWRCRAGARRACRGRKRGGDAISSPNFARSEDEGFAKRRCFFFFFDWGTKRGKIPASDGVAELSKRNFRGERHV